MRTLSLTAGGVASLLLVAAVAGQSSTSEVQPVSKMVDDNARRIEALEKQLDDLGASIDRRIAEELERRVGTAVEARSRQLAAKQDELFEARKKDFDERYRTALDHLDEAEGALVPLKAEIETARRGIQSLRVAVSSYPELEGKEAEKSLGKHDTCYLTSVKLHSNPIRTPDCSIHRRDEGWVLEAHHAACTATCFDLVLPELPPSNVE